MSGLKMLGIVLAVVGGVLLVLAFNSANAPVDQVTSTLTGRYTQTTMTYGLVGIAAAVGGVLMFLFGRRA